MQTSGAGQALSNATSGAGQASSNAPGAGEASSNATSVPVKHQAMQHLVPPLL